MVTMAPEPAMRSGDPLLRAMPSLGAAIGRWRRFLALERALHYAFHALLIGSALGVLIAVALYVAGLSQFIVLPTLLCPLVALAASTACSILSLPPDLFVVRSIDWKSGSDGALISAYQMALAGVDLADPFARRTIRQAERVAAAALPGNAWRNANWLRLIASLAICVACLLASLVICFHIGSPLLPSGAGGVAPGGSREASGKNVPSNSAPINGSNGSQAARPAASDEQGRKAIGKMLSSIPVGTGSPVQQAEQRALKEDGERLAKSGDPRDLDRATKDAAKAIEGSGKSVTGMATALHQAAAAARAAGMPQTAKELEQAAEAAGKGNSQQTASHLRRAGEAADAEGGARGTRQTAGAAPSSAAPSSGRLPGAARSPGQGKASQSDASQTGQGSSSSQNPGGSPGSPSSSGNGPGPGRAGKPANIQVPKGNRASPLELPSGNSSGKVSLAEPGVAGKAVPSVVPVVQSPVPVNTNPGAAATGEGLPLGYRDIVRKYFSR
jgi:hypothetical protein